MQMEELNQLTQHKLNTKWQQIQYWLGLSHPSQIVLILLSHELSDLAGYLIDLNSG